MPWMHNEILCLLHFCRPGFLTIHIPPWSSMGSQVLRIRRYQRLDMGLKRVSWVRRYQGQCRALRPLGHQGYRLRSYKKDPPLCSGSKPHPNLSPKQSMFAKNGFLPLPTHCTMVFCTEMHVFRVQYNTNTSRLGKGAGAKHAPRIDTACHDSHFVISSSELSPPPLLLPASPCPPPSPVHQSYTHPGCTGACGWLTPWLPVHQELLGLVHSEAHV